MFSRWRVFLLAVLLAAPERPSVQSAVLADEALPRRVPLPPLDDPFTDDYALLLAEGYVDPEQRLPCVPPGTIWEDRVTYDDVGGINVHTLCSDKRPLILPEAREVRPDDSLVKIHTVNQLHQLYVSY